MTLIGAVALVLAIGTGSGDISVSESKVTRGETITVSGAGCEPDSEVNLFLDGSIFARTRTDAAGAFLTPVTIADDVNAGSHEVTAIGSLCGATAVVEVEQPGSGDESESSDVFLAIAILLAAVIIAVTIVVASRRRWPDEPSEARADSQEVPPTAASTPGKRASTT